jgi:molybdopterin molybdotransferase
VLRGRVTSLPPSSPARHPADVTALVLAGGDSRRMGRDKALLRLGGRTLLERVVDRVRPHVREVLLSARDPSRYAFLGLAGVADSMDDGGPIVGIRDGLRAAAWPRVLVLACDIPDMDIPFLLSLVEGLDGADAVVPCVPPGVLQPTMAAYARSCLPHLDRVIDAGGRSVLDALATARVRVVPVPGVLWNLNTPEDLAAFVTAGLAGDDVRLPLPEAVALLRARLDPLPLESVALVEAIGRVPETDLVADLDVPPFPRAERDGWALQASVLARATSDHPVRLPVGGVLAAGRSAVPLAPATAIRILTGAPMPPGADTVVPWEETGGSGPTDVVILSTPVPPGRFVEPRGAEIRAGAVAWPRGLPLPPSAAGLLAACGHARVSVHRRAVVLVLPVGDELVPVGRIPGPGRIRASNASSIAALADAQGARTRVLPPAPDQDDALAGAIVRAAGVCDLLVTVGGTGGGDRDRVGAVLAQLGRWWFRGVALHPGSGSSLAEVGGTPCLALPGGVGGALAAWIALGRPVLDRLEGRPTSPPLRARLTAPLTSRRPQVDVLRPVRLSWSPQGVLEADPTPRGTPMAVAARAHALAVVPAGWESLAAGTTVECLPFARWPS